MKDLITDFEVRRWWWDVYVAELVDVPFFLRVWIDDGIGGICTLRGLTNSHLLYRLTQEIPTVRRSS